MSRPHPRDVSKDFSQNSRKTTSYTMFPPWRYQPSMLDFIENIESYIPGGYHPVSIGDVFANGRYQVLHKLGFGGSSTVWLARDSASKTLVALKVLSADKSKGDIAELSISLKLNALIAFANPACARIQTIKDSFIVEGPNGTHLCLVSQLAGPSVFDMSFFGCDGRTEGSRRLRSDLARKVAKQVAAVVELMHSAGLVHGDLTSSNILFQVSDQVHKWSDSEIYSTLGEPMTNEIITMDQSPSGPHAPREVVQPFDTTRLSFPLSFLEENVIVVDFGQSFDTKHRPRDYTPATAIYYFPPEALFDHIFCFASDIWVLACTIFEIRAGFSLMSSFLANNATVVRDAVGLLGKLPEPWWSAFEKRHLWFEENGDPKPPIIKTSIRRQLEGIGKEDDPPKVDQGHMIEIVGTALEEEEVALLGDLLEKMLKFRPEERITIQEVVRHPWFEYASGQ